MEKTVREEFKDTSIKQDYLLKNIHKSHLDYIRKLAKAKNLRVAGAIEYLVAYHQNGGK